MMKTINLLGVRKKVVLSRFRDMYDKVNIMIPIDKAQEDTLEKTENLTVEIEDVLFEINRKNVVCFGEVDITNQNDIDMIIKFDLIGHSDTDNVIYSNINFETGEVTFDEVPKQYPIRDAIKWYNYNWLLLGKPKRVCIFKYPKSAL